ncbi:unnamed protein product, partial [Timema podura]|nr:unnamed protein product [Timema podura]
YHSVDSIFQQVKKHQQRVMMILDSKNIEYTTVDITEPGKENEKEFMQQNSKTNDSKHPLPPQLFNEELYCGKPTNSLHCITDRYYTSPELAAELEKMDLTLTGTVSLQHNSTKTMKKGDMKAYQKYTILSLGWKDKRIVIMDYEAFDLANEIDELDKFLKMSSSVSKAEIILDQSAKEVDNGEVNVNGISSSRGASAEKVIDRIEETSSIVQDETLESKTETDEDPET